METTALDEEEERLRRFHERAVGEAARLGNEAARLKRGHFQMRERMGEQRVRQWYAEHEQFVQMKDGSSEGQLASAGDDTLPDAAVRDRQEPEKATSSSIDIKGRAFNDSLLQTEDRSKGAVTTGGTVDGFGLALSGPREAREGIVAYTRAVLAYERFERWGEVRWNAPATRAGLHTEFSLHQPFHRIRVDCV
eukprot:6196923-Pleurochrysis_carterae.AAC.2